MYTINLDFIAAEAKRRQDDYDAFKYYVELDERSDDELDTLVNELAAPIIDSIDCTQCGNCCRSLKVYVTEQDAEQLATGTQLSVDELLATVIDREQAAKVEEWGVFKQSPCSFLLKDNLCSVYAHRPESCRAYPVFTPLFRYMIGDILGGVGICPIIYHLIERLQNELNW